jgi:hypothetical protein
LGVSEFVRGKLRIVLQAVHHLIFITKQLVTEGLFAPPLDVGVRSMCLNRILKNEQIALMRYSAASDPAEVGTYRRKLSLFGRQLNAHPYPHRPYSQRTLDSRIGGAVPARAGKAALAEWENEGGAS